MKIGQKLAAFKSKSVTSWKRHFKDAVCNFDNVIQGPPGWFEREEEATWIMVLQWHSLDRLAERNAWPEQQGNEPYLRGWDMHYDLARRVTEYLGGEWHGDHGEAPSPGHSKKDRSLSIKAHESDPADVCLYSHTDGDVLAIKKDLRACGILPAYKPNGKAGRLGTIVATYDYTDEAGKLIFQVCRFDPKTFRQRRPNGSGKWLWKVSGLRVVPYRLPGVIAAIAAKRIVWIAEGEKDCDALAKLGLAASCNAGGASEDGKRPKWTAKHAAFFRGADVVILPDNDGPGRAHGEAVAVSLQGIAARVRMLDLPGLKDKGDVSDWLATAKDADASRLIELAESAPDWQPAPDPGEDKGRRKTEDGGKPQPHKIEYVDQSGFELSEPDSKGKQKRILNEHNAALAFKKQGVSFRFNEFTYENEIIGLEEHGPSLTPIAEKTLWALVWRQYRLKFGREDFSDLIDIIAWKNKAHPPREYFAEMQAIREAKPRDDEMIIETWAIDKLGVEDTKVSRFISRKALIATVRRARQPGVKFDTMPTLEGPQDFGKSKAIKALCPGPVTGTEPDWYTDNFKFDHKSGREDITQSQGKLMIEIPELDGMKPAAVNRTKGMLSRQFDECDMKYEKRATRRGRQATIWGTTNLHAYLFDETGNRRVWPLKCGVTLDMADLEGLAAIRDKLWGCAAHYEALGEAIHATADDVKEELAAVTDLRQVRDEWEPKIREKLIEIRNKCEVECHFVRTTVSDVREALGILLHEFDRGKQDRVRHCMRLIGWELTQGGRSGGPLRRKGRELWEPVKADWAGDEDEETSLPGF